MGEGGKISGRSDQETRRDGLLRSADSGRVGRAGARHGFLCTDHGGSSARVHGVVHGNWRDMFRGAGAAPDVRQRDAKEKISAAYGHRGNSWRVLLDGIGGE